MRRYILVNGITAFSCGLGLAAIFFAQADLLYLSYALALLAFITDSVDGYLARKLHVESRFGAIFDSLADVLVYLIYPAVLCYYIFNLNTLTDLFFLGIFIFAGIFRLVRFNHQGLVIISAKKFYTGLPVVFSHLIILILIITRIINPGVLKITSYFLLGVMSILMVTQFRFRKPSGVYLQLLLTSLLLVAGLMLYYAFR